jgi:hypothetical protein
VYADILEDKEQLSFWNQVEMRNRIQIKNPGIRTVFEHDLNLLGIQTCLKKSDKFPKILFAFLSQNMNLDWHDCMVRFEVSIHALIDLV